ncbi:hypothetical protein Tco_0450823 [Tanacetum coccineum]
MDNQFPPPPPPFPATNVPTWNPHYNDAMDFVTRCGHCQRQGNNYARVMMPQNSIHGCEICDMWALILWGRSRLQEGTKKTKRIHDAKIKNRVFNVGDRVLLFNSRLKIFSGKLKSRWSGPFTIVQVFPYGTVELSQNSGPNFKDFPDCEDSLARSINMKQDNTERTKIKGTDNQEKDEKQSQNDKTGLGMEKTVKDKAKSKPESQSSQKVNRKVNWSKSKSTPTNQKVNM